MAGNQRKDGEPKSEVVAQVPKACSDEEAAVEFMERQRWGDTPACPRCGDMDAAQMRDRDGNRNARFLWRCHGCKRQYTVRIGTVLEDSRIPLRHWCYAFWQAYTAKKGVIAKQIQRQTGLSYKSALFLMHRIRFTMAGDGQNGKRTGDVEVDETYVGGKLRNRRRGGRGQHDKALVQRGGNVRAWPIERVNAETLKGAIRSNVDRTAHILTDESSVYKVISSEFEGGHATVNHTLREYAWGDVKTNNVRGFFSLLKRFMYETFHFFGKRHLHRYACEFQSLYNTRIADDGGRLALAVKAA